MDWTFVISIGTGICVFAVVFCYLIYPLLIFLLSSLFGRRSERPVQTDDQLPFVSLLIAAYNEEENIGNRVENALSLDYPPDRLEIVIASDGSKDDTNEIVRRLAAVFPDRVRLLPFPVNRGKAAVLNDAVKQLRGSIVALSDANTEMRPDALRCLVAWFAQPDVGSVCGKLILTDTSSGGNVDGVYWKYETFLKKCESRLGALLGSNGAIYAIRKELFPGVPPGTIIDDFYIPLEAKRRSGCRIVYDAQAIATEETAPNMKAEFRRRSRIGAGGFQSIGLLWPLLSPWHGWVALSFLCHKVLRWLCPFLMIGALVGNLFLLNTIGGQYLMAAQLAAYALAAVGSAIPARVRSLRMLRVPTMFVSMNAALFVGFFKWLFGRQSGAWVRTPRSEPIPNLSTRPEGEVVA
jgi:cellulose synthase/poly-beta-1,6-N-acetylglucosamine synthase-like glycosyltransferase